MRMQLKFADPKWIQFLIAGRSKGGEWKYPIGFEGAIWLNGIVTVVLWQRIRNGVMFSLESASQMYE